MSRCGGKGWRRRWGIPAKAREMADAFNAYPVIAAPAAARPRCAHPRCGKSTDRTAEPSRGR